MLTPPYRTAVIGHTGRGDYGHSLDLAVLNQPKLDIVAVADPDEAGRNRALERLGIRNGYADYRSMLEREKPQFVVVAPRWLDEHKAMILACAEHGVRGVFCEKPLAPDLAACDAIVEACERAHMKLALAFQTRYSPRYERIKKLIADGAIGDVLELRGRGKEDARGGGEDLMVLGVHILDLCHDLLGPPAWCFARVSEAGQPVSRKHIRKGAEGIGPLAGDRVDAVYGFSDTAAVAHFATARPKEAGGRFGLKVFGSKGCISLNTGWNAPAYILEDPTWKGIGERRWRPIEIPAGSEAASTDGLNIANRAIVADLIQSVENDTRPRADVTAGRTAVEMVLACYASHAAGAAVPIPLRDRQRHPLETLAK